MPKNIYETARIVLLDDSVLEISPLKIKYLKMVLKEFSELSGVNSEAELLDKISQCVLLSMIQYNPDINTIEKLEDLLDIDAMYTILDIGAGIKLKQQNDTAKKEDDGTSWDDLDLAKLEAEVFMIGIWKDFDELERSISMPELTKILEVKREQQYDQNKFMAALQGVDLDKQGKKSNAWEDLKARVFSKGQAKDGNDILALQGVNAQKAGFGIGMGLEYEKL